MPLRTRVGEILLIADGDPMPEGFATVALRIRSGEIFEGAGTEGEELVL